MDVPLVIIWFGQDFVCVENAMGEAICVCGDWRDVRTGYRGVAN